MDPKINDHLEGAVVSQPSTSATIAVVESMPCRISDSSNHSCNGGNRREHLKAQLESQVQAAQHGHRGLESALHLMCERLLDLEDCWQQARYEKKKTEEKFLELQQECRDRQNHLSTLNDNVREDLCLLQSRVDTLAEAQVPEDDAIPITPVAAPANDAAVGLVATTAVVATSGDGNGVDHEETMAAMRQELHALRRKVEIMAANVLGEPEGASTENAPGEEGGKEREGALLQSSISDDDSAGKSGTDAEQVPYDIADIDEEENTTSDSQTDDERGASGDQGGKPQQHGQEEDGGESSRIILKKRKARNHWAQVRLHRAFLVKKIRRQMMAERKVSKSETIVTRVERLEKALGVNVYTTGSGRLDVLASDVRLSLAMIVEYQARAASDNLSAPLCLFPAREGDLSMISAAVMMPEQPRSSTRRPSGDAHDGRRGSRETRRSWSSISMGTSDGDSGDSSGGGDGGGTGSTVWGGGGGGDVGRLWLAEDAGYLCVDLLLERTLEELAEGLAFAASHVEKGRSQSLAACRGTSSSGGGGGITGGGGSTTSARASASRAAVDVAGSAAAAAAAASTTSKPSSVPTEHDGHQQEESERGSATTLKKEIGRMQDRCARLGALVARLGVAQQQHLDERGKGDRAEAWVQDGTWRRPSVVFAAEEQSEERGDVNRDAQRPAPEAAAGAIASEVLRLSCALAGDLQYLLSRPAYCRVLDAFAFTPGRKCLCGREFDTAGTAAAIPVVPAAAPASAGGKNGDAHVGRGSGGDNGRDRDQRGEPRQQPQWQQQGQAQANDRGAAEEQTHSGATGGASDAGTGDRAGKGQHQRPPPLLRHMPTFMSVPLTAQNGGVRPSGEGFFVVAGEGALEKASGFRVQSTLYQASGCASRREQGECCFVLSLGHLSSFLASARSRAAHRAVSLLTKELKRDVLAAELAARESVAAAAAARAGAREASAEALDATARAAAAAASARNEGSLLLVEFHEQLAKAMRAERDRLERDNYERARAERERVGQLLETQARKTTASCASLGHLKSLLDGKAGQEDLASITRAMGDVEETLTVVRQSIPGEKALQELQEALARKADKAYTKRKMALLVSRVSALLQEESEEPSMAKKCLSCDRAFNKLSFKELELAQQQLPEVLESAEDAAMRAQQQQQQMAAGRTPGGRGLEGEEHPTGDGPREMVADRSGSRSPGSRREQTNKRPGSAPSARSSTLEPRPFGNNRPRSAAPQRLVGGGGTNAVAAGFRPGSGGARSRTARGVGSHANSNSRLPPATGGPQPTTRQSPLFRPAALSATYGFLSDGARKAVESEAFRAERVSAREPSPAPDHIRYGGMTQAPLVRQLFSGVGGGVGGVGGLDTPTSVDGAHARGAVGNRIFKGGRRGRGGAEGRGRTGAGRGKGGEHLRVSGEGGGGAAAAAAAADERAPAAGAGDNHEGFASTLEHHRRNVIAVTVPPIQAVGAAGFVPETLTRGSGGSGSDGNSSKRGSKPYGA
ncbi:unnamed protein product [Ectocarpus sp. 8 AP-2014]